MADSESQWGECPDCSKTINRELVKCPFCAADLRGTLHRPPPPPVMFQGDAEVTGSSLGPVKTLKQSGHPVCSMESSERQSAFAEGLQVVKTSLFTFPDGETWKAGGASEVTLRQETESTTLARWDGEKVIVTGWNTNYVVAPTRWNWLTTASDGEEVLTISKTLTSFAAAQPLPLAVVLLAWHLASGHYKVRRPEPDLRRVIRVLGGI